MSADVPELTGAPLLDDEHKAYRESFRTFLSRRVVPHYPRWRLEGRIPRELFRIAGEHGFLGMQVPEDHGGAGVEDPRFGAVVAEEAMRAGAPALALALIAHNQVGVAAVVRHGSAQQRSTWLPRLASGDALAAVAIGELRISEREVVDGTAPFVVQGVNADLLVVIGECVEQPASTRAVLVERAATGVTLEPSPPAIGLQAAGLADFVFERASGAPLGDGDGPARELRAELELALAVTALAGAHAAMAITVDYVLERKAFGQPIASFQNTRHALGAAAADLDAAQAFVDACMRERLAGRLRPPRAAAVKLHCTELYGTVVDAGVQLHGGYGYMMEYPIAHAYADARFWRLCGATSEQCKDAIADSVLG
jgi:alkylation response protein AidB-like acyl-CoA dehydrogenase